ncbi:MAG: ATP-dependent helicase [Candidatus Dormibacteraeota bacterium]|uniref:DNA 3'-5' helicase n=1 Tax=Candidatus Aeolococcus gillhamiae TaxID=3127015 RepID=A0A934N4Y6_9BACT|nr:ATP-dependent helicase [Candidatus Dormibacteraeota bacterium]
MPSVPLDRDQQDAVAHRTGPCLVLAGPGSGKTRVIVERFLALDSEGVAASAQLVLTYTRKAAAEMRSRAEAAHGPFAGEPPLSNYHSFAGRVVRAWGWLAGISPAFRIADEAERWLHLEAVLASLRPRTLWNPVRPHDLVDSILDVIGKAKQELVTPERYAEWATAALAADDDPAARALLQRHEEIAAVYAALDERYLRCAVLDHDDTILRAEQLLREHDAPRHALCDSIEYVMVDEYQDTNYAQARLVETLVASHRNILVVADDDQAIYKFRGASLANLDRFSRTYPEHAKVVLSHNYRSTPAIVGAAGAVISVADPTSRIAKRLTAERAAGDAVELWEAPDERSEVLGVAAECRRLIESGTRAADIAWLFRRHADMRAAIGALREVSVPYQVQGGRGFFTQPEIKDLLALLSAAADPADTQALLRCLQLPSWTVSNRGRLALVQLCSDHDAPLPGLLGTVAASALDEQDAAGAARCVADVAALHAMTAREDVREIFYEALERSNFLGLLDQQSELARMQTGANLNKFGELLEAFADWSDDHRLATALRYLEVLRNSRNADELATIDAVDDGVMLLTAHSAKGLEWPVVILSGCVESRWPGRWTVSPSTLALPAALVPELPPDGDAVIDEERRLFYVALTRARDRLVLARARRYPRSFKDEVPSPFLGAVAGRGDAWLREVPAAAPLHPRPARASGGRSGERLSVGVSDIRVFKQCPRRFEYRHRYRLPVRDSLQSWYGTLMHTVLQNAAMRRNAGEVVDADRVAAIWNDAWVATRGPKGSHPELRELGEQQLRRYVEGSAWQHASVTAVEENFTLALDHADVHGRWDRLDSNGNGAVTVVDYKTGPPRDEERLRRDIQVRAYAVAVSRREHSDDVAVELHHLQTAEVTRVAFTREQLETSYRFLSVTAKDMAAAWRDGDFPPHPSAWNCTRCEYRTVCDEGRSTEQS